MRELWIFNSLKRLVDHRLNHKDYENKTNQSSTISLFSGWQQPQTKTELITAKWTTKTGPVIQDLLFTAPSGNEIKVDDHFVSKGILSWKRSLWWACSDDRCVCTCGDVPAVKVKTVCHVETLWDSFHSSTNPAQSVHIQPLRLQTDGGTNSLSFLLGSLLSSRTQVPLFNLGALVGVEKEKWNV